MSDGSGCTEGPARERRHREPELLLLHLPLRDQGAARGGRSWAWALAARRATAAAGATGAQGSRLQAAVPKASSGCQAQAVRCSRTADAPRSGVLASAVLARELPLQPAHCRGYVVPQAAVRGTPGALRGAHQRLT